ncbi:MAG: RNA-binding domain-containing protein [Fervidicoccaceae archaeon]
MQFRVRVEVPVKPTEKEEVILKLIESIITSTDVRIEGEEMGRVALATSPCLSSLTKLHSMLRRERILDSARKYLLSGIHGDTLTFLMHKQALAAGKISFVSNENESPLGPVIVTVVHPRIHEVVDWLAPPTREGKPIKNIDVPQPDCSSE